MVAINRDSRKCKLLCISDEDLIDIINKYCKSIVLPDDAVCTGVNFDPRTASWLTRIDSDEFEQLNKYQELPIIEIKERNNG